MKKLLLVLLAVVVVSALVFSGCPGPAPPKEPTVLKLVAFLPDVPPGNVFYHMLIDKVEAKSNGELIIDWVGGPEAIPPPDLAGAVQRGSIDMVSAIYSPMDAMIPGWECLTHMTISIAEFRKSEAWDMAAGLCEDKGIYFLGHAVPCKPMTMAAYFSKVKIEKPEDFAGLMIASPGPSYHAMVEALGATPVFMFFADYFTAMERGTVDGYTVGVPGIIDWGCVDVTNYMIDELMGSCGGAFLVNLEVWNNLSKDEQDVLTEAMLEVEIEGEAVWDNIIVDTKTQISAAGVEIIKFSPADSERFRAIYMETAWSSVMERNPELVAKFKEIVAP